MTTPEFTVTDGSGTEFVVALIDAERGYERDAERGDIEEAAKAAGYKLIPSSTIAGWQEGYEADQQKLRALESELAATKARLEEVKELYGKAQTDWMAACKELAEVRVEVAGFDELTSKQCDEIDQLRSELDSARPVVDAAKALIGSEWLTGYHEHRHDHRKWDALKKALASAGTDADRAEAQTEGAKLDRLMDRIDELNPEPYEDEPPRPEAGENIEALIEASSLGTPEAKAMRTEADQAAVEEVLRRVRAAESDDEPLRGTVKLPSRRRVIATAEVRLKTEEPKPEPLSALDDWQTWAFDLIEKRQLPGEPITDDGILRERIAAAVTKDEGLAGAVSKLVQVVEDGYAACKHGDILHHKFYYAVKELIEARKGAVK